MDTTTEETSVEDFAIEPVAIEPVTIGGPTAGDGAGGADAAPADLGVRATWQQTPRHVRALLAGVFVNKLAAFMQIFLVLFLTHRGYSEGQAGFALGMYGAGAVIGTTIGGSVSDRLSARAATLISMWGSAGLLLSIVYVHNYYAILVSVVLVSMIGQLYRPAAQAVIADFTPAERLVMVTAMYRLCLNLGTTAAPMIGVALASVSYNLLFWGEATMALAYGVAAIWMLPRRAELAQQQAPRETEAPGTPRKSEKGATGYRVLLRDRRYMIYLFAFLLLNLTYHQYTGALPLAIIKAGLSTWWYAAVISFNAVTVVLFEIWVTRYVQHWPTKVAQLCGYFLLATGYFCYAIHMAPLFIILGTLFFSVSEVVGAPTLYAYPGKIAPAHLRGRYFGAMQSTYGLGSTIGPIVGIMVFEHVGQRVFLFAALLAIAGAFIGQIGLRRPAAAPEAQPAV
jgi:MFS family permease